MKSNSKKHEGFTLLEVVISMMIISIMSVGVYNAYLLLIRQTKEGQVEQTVSLVGKKTIEDIKGYTDGISFDLTNKTSLDLGDIELEKKQTSINGNIEYYYEKEIYLDKSFEKSTDNDYVYIEKIKMEKAKSSEINDSSKKYDIDLDARKVSTSENDENTNIMKYNLEMIKDAGAGQKSYIKDEEGNRGEVIKNSKGQIILNVYIKTVDEKKVISIKDLEGNELLPEKKLYLESDKINQLDLYVNFSEYKKEDDEVLDNIEINIYNSDEETVKNITNIYIEKSRTLPVDVKARKGGINIYNNRAENGALNNLGTLYNIQVDISKDGKTIFSGYSNQNIDIE